MVVVSNHELKVSKRWRIVYCKTEKKFRTPQEKPSVLAKSLSSQGNRDAARIDVAASLRKAGALSRCGP